MKTRATSEGRTLKTFNSVAGGRNQCQKTGRAKSSEKTAQPARKKGRSSFKKGTEGGALDYGGTTNKERLEGKKAQQKETPVALNNQGGWKSFNKKRHKPGVKFTKKSVGKVSYDLGGENDSECRD